MSSISGFASRSAAMTFMYCAPTAWCASSMITSRYGPFAMSAFSFEPLLCPMVWIEATVIWRPSSLFFC
jgi:hypothetical protein